MESRVDIGHGVEKEGLEIDLFAQLESQKDAIKATEDKITSDFIKLEQDCIVLAKSAGLLEDEESTSGDENNIPLIEDQGHIVEYADGYSIIVSYRVTRRGYDWSRRDNVKRIDVKRKVPNSDRTETASFYATKQDLETVDQGQSLKVDDSTDLSFNYSVITSEGSDQGAVDRFIDKDRYTRNMILKHTKHRDQLPPDQKVTDPLGLATKLVEGVKHAQSQPKA